MLCHGKQFSTLKLAIESSDTMIDYLPLDGHKSNTLLGTKARCTQPSHHRLDVFFFHPMISWQDISIGEFIVARLT
jgi:hypothetical protein